MKRLGWIVCKALIERKQKGLKASLLSFLPPNHKDLFLHLPTISEGLCSELDLKNDILERTHYSWYLPFLRSFPEKEILFFLSSLPQHVAEKLRTSLKIHHSYVPISLTAQRFFTQKLTDFLLTTNSDLLPIKALKASSLHLLLSVPYETFFYAINLLGLHDLAAELPLIIDSHKLKAIYGLFPKEKQTFLKMLSLKKEPILFKRIEINKWDGKEDSLLLPLFQRGVNRLAKALYPESEDFIWYIKHTLDVETAQLFQSLHRPIENAKVYGILANQVLEALTFAQKVNPMST